jgi:four helix bundle protein
MHNYKNFIAWQKAVQLSIHIYKITNTFPDYEKFGLTNQLRRAGVSVPSNIAEGSKRGTKKDFKHFLFMANGSGAEIETQLLIAKELNYLSDENYTKLLQEVDETMRIITSLIKKFE